MHREAISGDIVNESSVQYAALLHPTVSRTTGAQHSSRKRQRGTCTLSVRTSWCALLVVAAVLAGTAAYHEFAAPRVGRILDFQVTEASDSGPSNAWSVVAEVAIEVGTPDDFAATAVAIASAVPADSVVVTLERSDLPSSAGTWRRTLARAEYRQKDKPAWTVSTAEPPLSKNEISASIEYSARVGLGLTSEGEPLSSDLDDALIKELAAKYGVGASRVMTFTRLHRERGVRTDWRSLEGPGSQHVSELARCYATKPRGGGAWRDCR